MTRKEFENYITSQNLSIESQKDHWMLYDKINVPGSPLSFNQRAYFLMGEL